MDESTRARFESKIAKNDGCWLWRACTDRKGYGLLRVGDQMARAPRISYELYVRPIPDGLHVLHRCDVPACVNPDHLFVGTNAENNADMMAKGRHRYPCGEAHGLAKLTADDVRQIRASTDSLRSCAVRFGVDHGTIGRVRRRETWMHIP